jgi:CTP:molybdopterin cytidylyltransferase MocA
MELEGDQGGRAIFGEFPVAQLPWLDEEMALDIDTREDYDRLTRIFFSKP